MVANCLNKLVQEKKRKEKQEQLWQNSLKALLSDNWLIAPCFLSPTQSSDTLHSLIGQYLHCTDCRSTAVLSDSAVEHNTEEMHRRLEGVSRL